ncbi:MAG: alpha/beta hydrolase [Bacteroidetes bacterium]|nr:alpha/beta hydrolase [Bacteroidota bacterium]MBU1372435.1 alpha/beta hydrolase [Bacteroidota bacterium]MBU1483459.1 alpha/beta hydrolase [Bacteroidota bacterium]MBU1760961.1 alpha/beta hydrolase [Bacteroidota bacterium]MBU2269195.1 alpha/beta hydrolase [Bacteroidota bacterium]
MKGLSVLFSLLMIASVSNAQEMINLYPGKIPNSKVDKNYIEKADTSANGLIRISRVSNPQLIIYYPEKEVAKGTAVIVCPGGGYSILAINHEGALIAKELNANGITAFVLKYRLPSDEIMVDESVGPLQDAQQAIKMVRGNADKFHVKADKIGVIGFSAGGHLASTLETHFQNALIDNPNKVKLRPDFAILLYPVITMGEFAHIGSKNNLLGKNPTDENVKEFSNELQVTAETPPTFIVQAIDDKTVPVENSIKFMQALKKAGVKCEMHLYQAGGHGFGLNNKTTKDLWFDRMMNWLKANQFVN